MDGRKGSIVITGTPGTGKSSVAEIVANKLNLRLVSLNQVAAESGAMGAKDERRNTTPIKAALLRKALAKLLDKEGNAVIEGHFGDLVPKKYVQMTIVLRTNPLVLRERLRERGYTLKKVRENVEAELLDACLIQAVEAFGEEEVREIDTTELSPEVVAKEVISAIEGGGDHTAGSISWVSRLEEAGHLRDLIP